MKRLQEEFKCECRLIDLKQEYPGLVGEERWAIVSELTEAELLRKYPEEIRSYTPFVCLSAEQAEVIRDFERNEDKFRKRWRKEDFYGYEEGASECFHRELVVEDYWEKQEENEARREEVRRLHKALSHLTLKQKERIVKHCVHEKSSRTIGQEEQVSYQVVDRSIEAAVKKLKKYF